MSLLEVNNLSVWFHTRNGIVKAVNDLSFSVDSGETLAIVGESGSGKSVCCYSLLGLIPCPPGRIESGSAQFDDQDLLTLPIKELRKIRGQQIATIFQDPMTCLNPYLSIGEQLIEPLIYHQQVSRSDARERAIATLEEVGIYRASERFDDFPHQFSGGMRQRVMIAMALIAEPRLLIADEPTTALDVTIQAQILELIAEIQRKRKLAMIFISHDLAVVKDIADNIAVMKDGAIVESGAAKTIFENPQHPYTQELLAAIPSGAKPSAGGNQDNGADSLTSEPLPPESLIKVTNLKTWFGGKGKTDIVKAVDDVSLNIERGEVLGVVGESGSGKSTLGRSILQLIKPRAGSVVFEQTELTDLNTAGMKPLRRRMQMIFQDPYASLNPRMSVFDALAEPLLFHGLANRKTVGAQVLSLMDDVGLAHSAIKKYPHEFSGGQRQRIAIGRAIALKPEFIVADEPVSALDVTIQKQILELIENLVAKHQLTMLFISHDLSVVRYLCDRIVVMHKGRLVEQGDTETIWANPQDAYTQQLLSAIPSLRD